MIQQNLVNLVPSQGITQLIWNFRKSELGEQRLKEKPQKKEARLEAKG